MKTNTFKLLISACMLVAASCTKQVVDTGNNIEASAKKASAHFIGENFGGGIVFYIDASGEHGLIAATADKGAATWWNGVYTNTGATDTTIGSGKINTRKIIQSQGKNGDYAARICATYKGGGFTDWFLPSKNELDELYKQKNIVGGFEKTVYWTSSENAMKNAWHQGFGGGYPDRANKSIHSFVRPVREF